MGTTRKVCLLDSSYQRENKLTKSQTVKKRFESPAETRQKQKVTSQEHIHSPTRLQLKTVAYVKRAQWTHNQMDKAHVFCSRPRGGASEEEALEQQAAHRLEGRPPGHQRHLPARVQGLQARLSKWAPHKQQAPVAVQRSRPRPCKQVDADES